MVNQSDIEKYRFEERLTKSSVGEIYLILNKVLAVCESNSIVFYKMMRQCKHHDSSRRKWEVYQEIPIRGTMQYLHGNKRLQIVADNQIYFYVINEETFEVKLENAMYNFMQCTQILLDP